jgi:16S rRNA (cytidine1402-2'-O)-methyltransferase
VSGALYVVATPIGNLEDITLRALRILREVDVVLAEDTRRTRGLLTHHGIATRVESLHAHTSEQRIAQLADALAGGARYALVSDAGTPLISDPGAELVREAAHRDVHVEAIPGASAVMAALCVAGVAAEHFRFVGFLPRSGKRRREALEAIARDRLTSVLFEAPARIADTLQDLAACCGATRRAGLCRELTKLHEQIARGSLEELGAQFAEGARGEITLVVEGAREDTTPATEVLAPELDVEAWIAERLATGLGTREIARELARVAGLDRREAYRRVLAQHAKPPSD